MKILTADDGKSYDFGIYDLHYYRYDFWPINFFAAWGHEIISARPMGEIDEERLSGEYPSQIRKRIHYLFDCAHGRLCGCGKCTCRASKLRMAAKFDSLYGCARSL